MTNATTNTNLQIIRVPQSRLLKKEMADYAEMTMGIVMNHSHHTSMFSALYDKLVAKKHYIEILRLDYGIDSDRFRISEKKNKLLLNIGVFNSSVNLLIKDHPDSNFHPLINGLNKHFRYLYRERNDKSLTQKVSGFFDLIETNEEVQALITKLELLDDVVLIDGLLHQFIKAVENRISKLAKRPNIKTQTLIRGLATSIENLHKAIEVAYLLSLSADDDADPDAADTVDYETLIGELNELNASYNRSINIRMHNNRRKAEQKKQESGNGAEDTEGADDTQGNTDPTGNNNTPSDDDDDHMAMQALGLYSHADNDNNLDDNLDDNHYDNNHYHDHLDNDDHREGELSAELDHHLLYSPSAHSTEPQPRS